MIIDYDRFFAITSQLKMRERVPTSHSLNRLCLVITVITCLIWCSNCVNQKTYSMAVPKPADPKSPRTSPSPPVKKPSTGAVKKPSPSTPKGGSKPGPAPNKKTQKPKSNTKKSSANHKHQTKNPSKTHKPIPLHASQHSSNSTQNKTGNTTNISAPLLPEILPPEHFNLTIVDPDHERHQNLTRQLKLLKRKLHKAKKTVGSFRDQAFVEALQEQMEDLLKKVKYDGDIVTKMKKEPVAKDATQKGENEQRVRTKKDSSIKIKKYLTQRDKVPPKQRMNLSQKVLNKSTLNDDKRFTVLRTVKSPFKKYPTKKLESNKKIAATISKPTKLLEI